MPLIPDRVGADRSSIAITWISEPGSNVRRLSRSRSGYPRRMDPSQNQPGTVLTCTNESCGCQLTIDQPCPHGDTYQCACGHEFIAADPDNGRG